MCIGSPSITTRGIGGCQCRRRIAALFDSFSGSRDGVFTRTEAFAQKSGKVREQLLGRANSLSVAGGLQTQARDMKFQCESFLQRNKVTDQQRGDDLHPVVKVDLVTL
jgi:hypothetical protein